MELRQCKEECRALINLTRCPNLAAVTVDNALCRGKADARRCARNDRVELLADP